MRVSRRYLTAIVLLAVFAVGFGVFGTLAPSLEEEAGLEPEQESSSESVGHFTNPPSYDSGWVDISSKCGQYVSLNHGLNTTDVVVDVSGKVSLDPMGGAIEWTRTYGGASTDYGNSVVETGDGGYALAGNTLSNGTCDFWLVKTDSAGNMMWNQTYGGASEDSAYSMVQTGDGGYAIAGQTSSYGAGGSDFWLVKTDSAGNMMWNQTYGGASSDSAYSMVQTGDGGYAIAGQTSSYGAGGSDFWLVKTDSAGDLQWNRTYGGTYSDRAYSLVLTDDGGYALAGYTYSYGAGTPAYRNFWLVKTDSAGNMQWSQAYTGPGSDDFAYSLVQTGDEGYALTGSTGPAVWLVKTDLAGNAQWNKTYGDAVVGDDFAYSLVETGDGGYAMAGYTFSYGTGTPTLSNSWLVKTDGVGNMEWSRAYGGVWSDEAYSVVETSDGGYALAGYTNSFGSGVSDFWLIKITGEMNVEHRRNFSGANPIVGWTRTYGGKGSDFAYSLIRTSDGGYALAGSTLSIASSWDAWLVKTDSAGNMLWSQTYGGANEDFAESVVQTSDGGYALAGYTNSSGAGGDDFWLVKTDSAGNMMWDQTYGGAYNDNAVSVVQTVDGGYALVGYTFSYGTGTPPYCNFWFIKTDSVGNTIWNRIFGEYPFHDFASSVIQTSDGGYAIAGILPSYSAPFWLLKTDMWGIPQWNKTYGGIDAWARSVIETGDGGYALAGWASSDFYLVKTDSVGTLQWNKTYGGAGMDLAYSVVQTSDGGYALAGYTDSSGAGGYDFWLAKTDASGTLQWDRTYGGTSNDYARSVVQTSDGGYALAGYTYSYGAGGSSDFWLVKTDVEMGFTMTGLTNNSISLYRGKTDPYWNYVRVRIWLIKEPSWIYGDINMDGIVDNKDLYIIGKNYGQTFSLLSLTGIIAIAGIHTVKKRRQTKQPSYIR